MAAAAAAAGAPGEPSSVSVHSACEGKPGDEAGRLRQLLASQKAGHEVRCLRGDFQSCVSLITCKSRPGIFRGRSNMLQGECHGHTLKCSVMRS